MNYPTGTLELRPEPLRDAAGKVATWVGFVNGLLTSAAGYGLISLVTSDALVALFGLIPGVVAAIGTVVSAFSTAARARPDVTPVDDPRDNQNRSLLPASRA